MLLPKHEDDKAPFINCNETNDQPRDVSHFKNGLPTNRETKTFFAV